jgi:integrase
VANRAVGLIWYCRTPRGWRRFPVVIGKNGRVRHGVVLLDGKEHHFAEGRFQLRSFEGDRTIYENAGENAADAMAARDRAALQKKARITAEEAGTTIIEEVGRVAIRPAIDKYVKRALDAQALEAVIVYRAALDQFLEATAVRFLDEVTGELLQQFHSFLRRKGNGARTISNKHAHVKGFLLWAGVDVKCLKVRPPTPEKKLPRVYSLDELDSLLATNEDEYFGVVLDVLRMTGLREAEAVHLTWADVDYKRRVVRVRSKPEMGFAIKDREQRDVPLPSHLARVLQEWRTRRPESTLVLGTARDLPQKKWLRALKRLAYRAKLNCGRCKACRKRKECERFNLHSFRRTFATTLAQNGVDVRTIQHILGHADLATTLAYLAPMKGEAAQAMVDKINW